MSHESLDNLRERIRKLDLELIERVAERVELTRQAGEIKRRDKLPTVDYAQEKVVLERARTMAEERGLKPRAVEDLFAALIRASVMAQDEDSLRMTAAGAGQTAVVIGGAGRMGRWFKRFLSAQGYATLALDPEAPTEESEMAERRLPSADLIICSIPPVGIAGLYSRWTDRPPAGIVADIASIKTPLIDPIRSLQHAGGRVASIHPMFGPSTLLLRDEDLVICDTGDREAASAVEKLFQPTTARIVHMPIEDHDRVMADLLNLSHAAAIAVAVALPENEHSVSSPTFRVLRSLAGAVVRESADVYYEIQVMNPHSEAALQRLASGVDRLIQAVRHRDPEAFRSLLEEGRRHTPPRKI